MKVNFEKLGLKCREMWNSPSDLKRVLSSPYIFMLYLRKRDIRLESPFVQAGNNSYYLGINKCANTTIRVILNKRGFGKRIYLANKKKISRLNENNFLFTFVRNPYDRVLSVYLDKIKRQAMAKYVYSFNGVLEGLSGKDISFDMFVKIISSIPDKITDPHLKSYTGLINEHNLRIDFVGKLENFNNDWKIVSCLLDLPEFTKSQVKNKSKRKGLEDYYTPELKKLVYKRYKQDFENFGYDE